MKKRSLLIIITALILSIGTVSAQGTGFGFGVKTGVNVSNIKGKDIKSMFDPKAGWNVSLFADYGITNKFAVELGAGYSMQGAKSGDGTTKLGYITIPILAKYYILGGLNIFAGPQINILADSKYKVDDIYLNIKDNLKTGDFGVNVGAGYQFGFGMNVGLSYTFGFVNISKAVDTILGPDKMKNGTLQATVGWKF